jgi:hypothetical protein
MPDLDLSPIALLERQAGAAEERADTVAMLVAIAGNLEKGGLDASFLRQLIGYIADGVQRGASWGRQSGEHRREEE